VQNLYMPNPEVSHGPEVPTYEDHAEIIEHLEKAPAETGGQFVIEGLLDPAMKEFGIEDIWDCQRLEDDFKTLPERDKDKAGPEFFFKPVGNGGTNEVLVIARMNNSENPDENTLAIVVTEINEKRGTLKIRTGNPAVYAMSESEYASILEDAPQSGRGRENPTEMMVRGKLTRNQYRKRFKRVHGMNIDHYHKERLRSQVEQDRYTVLKHEARKQLYIEKTSNALTEVWAKQKEAQEREEQNIVDETQELIQALRQEVQELKTAMDDMKAAFERGTGQQAPEVEFNLDDLMQDEDSSDNEIEIEEFEESEDDILARKAHEAKLDAMKGDEVDTIAETDETEEQQERGQVGNARTALNNRLAGANLTNRGVRSAVANVSREYGLTAQEQMSLENEWYQKMEGNVDTEEPNEAPDAPQTQANVQNADPGAQANSNVRNPQENLARPEDNEPVVEVPDPLDNLAGEEYNRIEPDEPNPKDNTRGTGNEIIRDDPVVEHPVIEEVEE
jgi:gas vesicle protein